MPAPSLILTLPSPVELRKKLRSCAILNLILAENDSDFTFQYHPRWREGVILASWSNGSGDDVFVLFRGDEPVIKGFDHESVVSPYQRKDHSLWPGLYEGLPKALADELANAAISMNEATLCLWWTHGQWHSGPVSFPNGEDDHASYLLPEIQKGPAEFIDWAEENYERAIDREAVGAIFAGASPTDEMILTLHPGLDLTQVRNRLSPLD